MQITRLLFFLLKKRCSNNQLIVDTHYIKLMDMVLVLNKMTLLLAMYDAIEQYLRSQSKKTSKSKKISEKTSIKDRTSH